MVPFRTLRDRPLIASDGRIGEVREFYFSEENWAIRYLVISIRSWFDDRLALIPVHALERINPEDKTISVRLNKQQVLRAVSVESETPVSEQPQERINQPERKESQPVPGLLASALPQNGASVALNKKMAAADSHLRCSEELRGNYTLMIYDGKIGLIEGLIIEDDQWRLRYLVVRTGFLLSGKLVLIPPQWINRISFEQREILVGLPCSLIKEAPDYDFDVPIDRVYEQRVDDHFSRAF